MEVLGACVPGYVPDAARILTSNGITRIRIAEILRRQQHLASADRRDRFSVATFRIHGRPRLRVCPINPDWVIEGAPKARACALSHSRDGLCSTVMWTCTPGVFEWHYDRDETLHLLSGRVVLDAGLPTERCLEAGDGVYFPAGSVAIWHVLETVTKVAFVRRPVPQRLVWLLNLLRYVKNGGRPRRPGMFGEFDAAGA